MRKNWRKKYEKYDEKSSTECKGSCRKSRDVNEGYQGGELCPYTTLFRSAVKILIAVVLGALLLAGLYALFGDVVMPTLTQRIQDMFNYAG